MKHSLLFLPDISGFTKFVQTTEVEHSQHVISELLEVLIAANTLRMPLAEVEGDALFFYLEDEIPSQEMLLAQIESMFTAFYSHLKMLEKNRICPCDACFTAPNLQLKIVAHCGNIQFITVQGKRKPFGSIVIEAHRLLKNSIDSDNYVLMSQTLADGLQLSKNYMSKLYKFGEGSDSYDDQTIDYLYSKIDKNDLKLKPFLQIKKIDFEEEPEIYFQKSFPVPATKLLELITNYKYRHLWVPGEIEFKYNAEEVTRIGSEHICVINGKHLDFVAISKDGKPGQLIYGELTASAPPVDKLFQYFIINPATESTCHLEIEIYWEAKSIIKKLILLLFGKTFIQKNVAKSMDDLHAFVSSEKIQGES